MSEKPKLSQDGIDTIGLVAAMEVLRTYFMTAAVEKYSGTLSERVDKMACNLEQAGPLELDPVQAEVLTTLIRNWIVSVGSESLAFPVSLYNEYCREVLHDNSPEVDVVAKKGLADYIGQEHNGAAANSGEKVAWELRQHYG